MCKVTFFNMKKKQIMAKQLILSDNNDNKEELYISLFPQIKSLIDGETDLIANLANIAAVLKEAFNFFWVGFYIVKNNQLVLAHSKVLLLARE